MTTETGTNVIQALIQGLVEIDEEYERVVKPLEEKRKKQREKLRDVMIEAEKLEAIDEVSGYKAVLVHQQRDIYVAEKLLPLLPRPEMADDVMVTSVDAKAVQELVDGGLLTRPQMEREGALLREAKTRPFIKLVPLKGVRP
ncbi:hypothetical protein LCGC14_2178300 [marine sediment metagenome]|uniref:Uncharacterized protein n=1 Tax=marine sediment metagenome TaxID=412755 RepID=A0A0F9G0K4_9ZZZZ